MDQITIEKYLLKQILELLVVFLQVLELHQTLQECVHVVIRLGARPATATACK